MFMLGLIIALFALAIVAPWVLPNKMWSKNVHDIKG